MGQPDQGNESWDRERLTASRLAALNGRVTSQGTSKHKAISSSSTGEHRPIPQRPPNMPYVDENPEKRRVPRPEYQPKRSGRTRPRLIVLGAIAAAIVIFVIVIFSLLVGAINQSADPSTTAVDFVSSLATQNYDSAYQDLSPRLKLERNLGGFKQQAQTSDQQFGKITDYTAAGKATFNNNEYAFNFTITREKGKSYNLRLILYQDPNDKTWKVDDYGSTLGPPQP